MLDLLIAIHENVEIDVPRALVNKLLTAHGALDVLQFIEESQGLEFGLNLPSDQRGSNLNCKFYTETA